LLPSLASRMRPLPPEIEAVAEPHAGANSDEEEESDDGVAGADEDRRAPPRALRGSSLGPQWMSSLMGAPHRPQAPRERAGFGFFVGASAGSSGEGGGSARGADGCLSPVFVERDCEVVAVEGGRGGWPVAVRLSNGRRYGCDFVVSATGVEPNADVVRDTVALSPAGAILVSEEMRSSDPCGPAPAPAPAPVANRPVARGGGRGWRCGGEGRERVRGASAARSRAHKKFSKFADLLTETPRPPSAQVHLRRRRRVCGGVA
jgi:hypothetical protein